MNREELMEISENLTRVKNSLERLEIRTTASNLNYLLGAIQMVTEISERISDAAAVMPAVRAVPKEGSEG